MTDARVMASRTLTLASEPPQEIVVRLMAPVLDGRDYRCDFQIVGLGEKDVGYAMGADGIQALFLALKMIGTRLYTSAEGKAGLILLDGSPDLDFPLPEIIADLGGRKE